MERLYPSDVTNFISQAVNKFSSVGLRSGDIVFGSDTEPFVDDAFSYVYWLSGEHKANKMRIRRALDSLGYYPDYMLFLIDESLFQDEVDDAYKILESLRNDFDFDRESARLAWKAVYELQSKLLEEYQGWYGAHVRWFQEALAGVFNA